MIPLPTRAYVFIGLNFARFLSVLTLILVFSSTIQVMVGDIHAIRKGSGSLPNNNGTISIGGTEYYIECDYLENSTVPVQPGGSMFAIVNHLFIIFQCVLLILSEVSWPASFFADYIPVLAQEHGVAVLGFMQIFIGAAVLSHHVPTFALVSAFFLYAVGWLNLLLGLTFGASLKIKRSLNSWREIKNTPSLPRTQADFLNAGASAAGVFGAGSFGSPMTSEKPGFGFGRQGERTAALRGFVLSRPTESLPRYAGVSPTRTVVGLNLRGDGPSNQSPRASSRAGSNEDSDDESTDSRPHRGAAGKPNRI